MRITQQNSCCTDLSARTKYVGFSIEKYIRTMLAYCYTVWLLRMERERERERERGVVVVGFLDFKQVVFHFNKLCMLHPKKLYNKK